MLNHEADVAAPLLVDSDVPGSNPGRVRKWMNYFGKLTRFENCLNFQNARAIILQKWTAERKFHISIYRKKTRTRDSWFPDES